MNMARNYLLTLKVILVLVMVALMVYELHLIYSIVFLQG